MCYNVRVQVRVKAGHVATRVRPKWLLQPLQAVSQPAPSSATAWLAAVPVAVLAGWLAVAVSASQPASCIFTTHVASQVQLGIASSKPTSK